jgi:hypothetical protein
MAVGGGLLKGTDGVNTYYRSMWPDASSAVMPYSLRRMRWLHFLARVVAWQTASRLLQGTALVRQRLAQHRREARPTKQQSMESREHRQASKQRSDSLGGSSSQPCSGSSGVRQQQKMPAASGTQEHMAWSSTARACRGWLHSARQSLSGRGRHVDQSLAG